VQISLFVVAIVAIVVATVTLVIFCRRMLLEARKVGRAAEDVSRFAQTADREITQFTQSAGVTLSNVDELAASASRAVERLDGVVESAERLIDVGQIALTATKAARSSTAAAVSVYEGIKQGIKTLRVR
jgi:hypothetical protein